MAHLAHSTCLHTSRDDHTTTRTNLLPDNPSYSSSSGCILDPTDTNSSSRLAPSLKTD